MFKQLIKSLQTINAGEGVDKRVRVGWFERILLKHVYYHGEFHGQRSLVSYSRWGRKESDMTEQHTHTQKSILIYLFEKLLSFNILTLCLSSFKFILHNPRYTYRYIFFVNIKRKYLLIWKTTLSIILNENSRLQQ